jgi:homoprotocatechuate degradation regulator HpaR
MVRSRPIAVCCGAKQFALQSTESTPFFRIKIMARKISSKAGTTQPDKHRVPMREFSRSLPMALLRAREAVMRQFRPSLRHHGLTEQQWRILRALAAVDAIEVTELAHVAFLLGPSLSRILRDLEARHLIERKVAKTDLRRAVVSISAKGLKLIEAVAPSSEAIYAAITRRYGARKLAELQDTLRALEGSLAGMDATEQGGIEADE